MVHFNRTRTWRDTDTQRTLQRAQGRGWATLLLPISSSTTAATLRSATLRRRPLPHESPREKGAGIRSTGEKGKRKKRMAAQLLKDVLGITKLGLLGPFQRGLSLYSDLHSHRKWSISRRWSWTPPRQTAGWQWGHQGLHFVHAFSSHRGKGHRTQLLKVFLATCQHLEEDWGLTEASQFLSLQQTS